MHFAIFTNVGDGTSTKILSKFNFVVNLSCLGNFNAQMINKPLNLLINKNFMIDSSMHKR